MTNNIRVLDNGRKRSTKVSKNTSLNLKQRDITLYHNNILQNTKGAWVAISPGYIYISRDKGRSYWFIKKVRPVMTHNDKTMTIKVASNKIVFKSPAQYNRAKLNLGL